MLDAPVSGGVKGAEDGTLSFIVGGKDEDLVKASSLLTSWAAIHFMPEILWLRSDS